MHFKLGLPCNIRRHVVVNGCPTDTLNDLAVISQHVFDIEAQMVKENPCSNCPNPALSTDSHAKSPSCPKSVTPHMDSRLTYLTSCHPGYNTFPKLEGDQDGDILCQADICFCCCKKGHISLDCPEKLKKEEEARSKPHVKVESIEQPVIVELDKENSPCLPVPTIPLPVRVAQAKAPSLVNSGTSVNMI